MPSCVGLTACHAAWARLVHVQVTDGSATVTTTADAVVLSAQTALSSFTSTVLEARATVAPSGTFYLIKVGGVCGGAALRMRSAAHWDARPVGVCVVVAQAVNDGADKFSVSGAGVVAVTGTLAVSGAGTISGVLTSSVGLTVTAGGLSVTSGGLTVTAGGLTVTSGGLQVGG